VANSVPSPAIYGVGGQVANGYPVYLSKDSAGTGVAPFGLWVWNPNTGTNGLWVPASVDGYGMLQVSQTVNGQPVSQSNPLPTVVQGLQVQSVTATNINIQGYATQQVVFQNAVSVSGNGNVVTVRGFRTLLIEIFGANSPAGTVNFQAASVSGVFTPITGINLNGLSPGTSTSSISTTPSLWQFDVSGLDSFQCPVTRTAGTITVQGRLMA
jgi:hypothetical protein